MTIMHIPAHMYMNIPTFIPIPTVQIMNMVMIIATITTMNIPTPIHTNIFMIMSILTSTGAAMTICIITAMMLRPKMNYSH